MFFVSFSLVLIEIEINKRKEERTLWRQKKQHRNLGLTVQVYGASGIVTPVENYNAGGSHGGDFLGPNRPLKQLTTLSRCFVVFSPQNAVTQNNFKRLPAQQQPGVRSLCRYAREKKCNLGTYAKSTTRLRQYLGARKSIAGLPNTPIRES